MVAFAGLWLGSLAMKKATEEVTNFTNFVRRDLGALKKELNGRVSEIERMQIKLQKRLEQSKEVEGTTRQMINEIKVERLHGAVWNQSALSDFQQEFYSVGDSGTSSGAENSADVLEGSRLKRFHDEVMAQLEVIPEFLTS